MSDTVCFAHLATISLTEDVISSDAAATDCTLLETLLDAVTAELESCCVVSAVCVSVSAAALSSVDADESELTMLAIIVSKSRVIASKR